MTAIIATKQNHTISESMKEHYTYILCNKRNGTLYVGSTSDLVRRVWQHKHHFIKNFTAEYDVHRLAYYETHGSYEEAGRREKRFKNWSRQWKINLIESVNPYWRDLYDDICG